jgi:hypothetical protein
MSRQFSHVRDRDLNHYVIPADRSTEWEQFLDAVQDWQAALLARRMTSYPTPPVWAVMVDVTIADSYAAELTAAGG